MIVPWFYPCSCFHCYHINSHSNGCSNPISMTTMNFISAPWLNFIKIVIIIIIIIIITRPRARTEKG